MTQPITRITMMKIPSHEHQTLALEEFETFTKCQKKDGKPYILSMQAGRVKGNVTEQGYTLVAKSTFKDEEDMKFYECECEGHQQYKEFLKANAPVESLMTCVFIPEVTYENDK